MDNKILNMKMTNFQPESRDMAIFGKSPFPMWSSCIYIAITFEILVQNRLKIVFFDSSCHEKM